MRSDVLRCIAVEQPIFNIREGMLADWSAGENEAAARLINLRFGSAGTAAAQSPLAHTDKLLIPVLNLHSGLPSENQKQFSELMTASMTPYTERSEIRGFQETSEAILAFFAGHLIGEQRTSAPAENPDATRPQTSVATP